MKSLFSRFRSKDKDKDGAASPSTAEQSRRTSLESVNNPGLAGSRRQSINHDAPSRAASPAVASASSSRASTPNGLSLQPPAIPRRSSSAASHHSRRSSALGPPKGEYGAGGEDGEQEDRERTLSATYLDVLGAGGGKKVTFRSPIPTPPASALMDDISPPLPPPKSPPALPQDTRPNTLRKHSLPPLTTIRPLHPSGSSATNSTPSPSRPHTRIQSNMTSPVPSASMSIASETSFGSMQSYLAQPNSWSEMAEEDLIANLGPRERTRQEVLWEIVSSEERYVQELVKLNDTFCRRLLPPSAQSPTLTLHDPLLTLSRTLSPSSMTSPTSPGSHDSPNLPIAARYSRSASTSTSHTRHPSEESRPPSSTPTTGAAARLDAYNKLTNGRPSGAARAKVSISSIRDRARAHQSLPPLSRGIPESRSGSSGSGSAGGSGKGWSGSFARLSHPTKAGGSRVGSGSSLASIAQGQVPKEVALPDELAQVLSVLSGGILEGHLKLAAALRKRYEDQYPLVRSLADVFTAHSYILRGYATYILHLEAALGTIDSALSLATRPPPRRHSRQSSVQTAEYTLGKALLAREELATERGESGLAISLSKPFQRLLKYPLLFQNLLFNTDPSLREYEATLAMVDEVEMIVRGIEDEKVGKEESERTRDVWARIEGLESDKASWSIVTIQRSDS